MDSITVYAISIGLLNASVDARGYVKIKSGEEIVPNSQDSVFDYQYQMVNLAKSHGGA